MRFFEYLRASFQRLLVVITFGLMLSLVVVVVLAVVYRKAGASLVWYDEVASIMLAWLTYYGAALAALRRAHIGFPGIVEAVRPPLRLILIVVGEICVFGFFILLAWVGYHVVLALEGDTLVSLPDVSTQFTQSVIPVGAVLFVIAQALSLPKVWRDACQVDYGRYPEQESGG